jgi:ABC-type glycerol-3-phosphate transport system substrate-binding protein
LRVLIIAVALLLVACGGSKSTHTPGAPTNGGTVSSTVPPGTTSASTPAQSNASTPCTIPQHNGGDHDADNNGGPSDGDGCDR